MTPPQTAPIAPPATARTETVFRVAIVGGGPRGLAAAEALAGRVAETGLEIALTVFDDSGALGAGPNYHPDQLDLNRLNIPLRAIDIACADFSGADREGFSKFLAETKGMDDPELYPARADLGAYLQKRWADLERNAPQGLEIEAVGSRAGTITRSEEGWLVDGAPGAFDAVLVTLGHQGVSDPQIEKWQDHAKKTGGVFLPAYPSSKLLQAADGWSGRTVAIRGMGLSTIDVVRVLTLGLGGRFETGETGLIYKVSGREPEAIVPFSLDGVPPAPKPANGEIDAAYDLDERAESVFIGGVSNIIAKDLDDPLEKLVSLILDVSKGVQERFDLKREALESWLKVEITPKANHPIDERPAREIMAQHLAMADNAEPPSPGYAIGQIWRKLQTPLRKAFNPLSASAAMAEALARFDEAMKRFSYGPPPEAIREMLALIDAKLLDLKAVDDPDIALVETGWRLSTETQDKAAQVMIDAVLPAADLAASDTQPIAGLRDEGLLVAAGEKLGVKTRADGTALGSDGQPILGLAVLGRMATGSVIATDSIHDCFGASAGRWADEIAARAKALKTGVGL